MTTTTKTSVRLTRRVREIRISPTIAVMNRAQELIAKGVDVVDFGAGEPDFPTPPLVAAAGRRAIAQGFTKYTSNAGTKALRDAIAARYERRWGAHVTSNNVIAGTGGKQELFNVILSLVEPGDEVIIPSPRWVSFPDQVQFAGGTPVSTIAHLLVAQYGAAGRYRGGPRVTRTGSGPVDNYADGPHPEMGAGRRPVRSVEVVRNTRSDMML